MKRETAGDVAEDGAEDDGEDDEFQGLQETLQILAMSWTKKLRLLAIARRSLRLWNNKWMTLWKPWLYSS